MKDINFLINNKVNVSESLELLGDVETYNETLRDFLNEVSQKLSQISEYKNQGDMPNYAILVHSLKSDAKYLGFPKLAELSYNHEMESKSNNNVYVNEHYEELMIEANNVVNIVKEYFGDNNPNVSVNSDVN